jgi:cysteine desulfurase
MRKGSEPAPLIHGGGQERGLRSGTLSPALCVGFGAAAQLTHQRREQDHEHVEQLWVTAGSSLMTDWVINGSVTQRYHGNLNVYWPGVDAARLVADLRDIAFLAGQRLRQRVGPSEPCASRDRPVGPRGPLVHPARLRPLHDRRRDYRRGEPDRRGGPGAAGHRRLTLVRFFKADGTLDREVEAAPGQRLLDVAWAERQPLEGACEGVMGLFDLSCDRRSCGFRKIARGKRGGRGFARPRRPRRANLAARLPDRPYRGFEEPERPDPGRGDQLDGTLVASR